MKEKVDAVTASWKVEWQEAKDMDKKSLVKLAVRELIEFTLRSGNIDARTQGAAAEAMLEGGRLHRKLQKSMGSGYQAEVGLSAADRLIIEQTGKTEKICLPICVEGRADGIYTEAGMVVIDEIKSMYQEVKKLTEPKPLHLAQAKCYAYFYARQNALDKIKTRMTYVQVETEEMNYFYTEHTFDELEEWYRSLLLSYAKWMVWQRDWDLVRNESIKKVEFPFAYRPGQKELTAGVYRSILREKKLYIEAPTGVGKTISTIFPAVKAIGEGEAEKIFYLTAKTITRTVAEEAFLLLEEKQGLRMKCVTITAKDKVCVLPEPNCNPDACERARGHYDRVNDAVYALLVNETGITRKMILEYAERYCVCPFEMCLDVTLWADAIICDYNYLFDPVIYLKRFFYAENEKEVKQPYIFLVDEAHNLVERARDMYSMTIAKEDILRVKRLVKAKSGRLAKYLDGCNKEFLSLKRQCDEVQLLPDIDTLAMRFLGILGIMEDFLLEHREFEGRDEVLTFYFNLRRFLMIYDWVNEKYRIYTDYNEKNEFQVTLKCMDPSEHLNRCLMRGKSSIFFSATFLPIQYYKEQLAGSEEDYAVYAPSPFLPENRAVFVATDVSTLYKRRSEREFRAFARYIRIFTEARKGNYMVFFPSYQMLHQVLAPLEEMMAEQAVFLVQKPSMTEIEKEEFLAQFVPEAEKTVIGLCVMGGSFGEGIDLKGERLIGAVIVGPGLPMVCTEREIYREYYDEAKGRGNGFDYAYLYQGMNKVLQSAGRVIRTQEDRGTILLLDERFGQSRYQKLFPREWFPLTYVSGDTLGERLRKFWQEEHDATARTASEQ